MIADSALTYLSIGAMFGLTAGLSPGPMLMLIISQTLQHNKSEGTKIAFAPLITDLPVILITYFIFSQFSQYTTVLGIIALAGGIYVTRMGYLTMRTKALTIETTSVKPDSFKKGIITSFLNPNPYFFWLTVGTPIIFKAYNVSLVAVIVFLLSFYTMLVGSAIGIALVVEHTKTFLKSNAYLWVMRILGVVLMVFALFFFRDAVKILFHT